MNDGTEMEFFRRDSGETLLQVEPHLVAKNAERPGPGAIRFRRTAFENESQQIEVLTHVLTFTGPGTN